MSTQLPPEGISQSAWDEAREVVADTQGCNCSHCVGTIARAIMAATERAALIADEHRKNARYSDRPYATACADIAAAVRQGSQPSTSIPHLGTVK